MHRLPKQGRLFAFCVVLCTLVVPIRRKRILMPTSIGDRLHATSIGHVRTRSVARGNVGHEQLVDRAEEEHRRIMTDHRAEALRRVKAHRDVSKFVDNWHSKEHSGRKRTKQTARSPHRTSCIDPAKTSDASTNILQTMVATSTSSPEVSSEPARQMSRKEYLTNRIRALQRENAAVATEVAEKAAEVSAYRALEALARRDGGIS